MMIIDYYRCECGRILPKGSICSCLIDKKINSATQLAQMNLIQDILKDITDAMPSAPITKQAYQSWKEKYSDLLYIKTRIEDKRVRIMNGDYK